MIICMDINNTCECGREIIETPSPILVYTLKFMSCLVIDHINIFVHKIERGKKNLAKGS